MSQQKDRSTPATTRRFLGTPCRIFYPDISFQIPPTRHDFSKNRNLTPENCWCLWYRRNRTEDSNFHQWVNELIRSPTRFSEFGPRAWPGAARKSTKLSWSWSRSWTLNSWLDWTKRRDQHTGYETTTQALLQQSSARFNHSLLGQFVCSPLSRGGHPKEKRPSRGAISASTVSVPPHSSPESKWTCSGICSPTGFHSRGSWHFGLARS
jgi:hypothetical protein